MEKEISVNEKLVNQIGEINEISVIPRGSYGYKKNSSGTFGRAKLNVILKGKNEYKKIQALVTKEKDSSGWNVINIEY
ncbi:MAG: hypothetical protein GYB35_17245 [Algicola sp.]|nr:hypothetical protein [Algicola sp.]